MTSVSNYKTVGKPFSNAKKVIEVEYDFSKDAGAVGVLDLMKAQDNMIVTGFYVKGDTELDSAADGVTIDVGIKGGDSNALIDGIAEAVFATGAVVYDKTNQIVPLKLAADDILSMEILGEALTSGKCKFCFELAAF